MIHRLSVVILGVLLLVFTSVVGAATLVINEDFDTGEGVNADPTSGNHAGTFIPNKFTPADVPGHSGPDTNLQPQIISVGGDGQAEYVEARGGGPEYDLDGYYSADQAVTVAGSKVFGSFNMDLRGGEAVVGLTNNVQAMVDGTDGNDANFGFRPGPNSAMLWGLFFGEGYGSSGGGAAILGSIDSSGNRVNLSTGVGENLGDPLGFTHLEFNFQYTVGEAAFDSMTISGGANGGAQFNNTPLVRRDNGGPVPVTNPGGFDGFFWGDGDLTSNFGRNSNFIIDDIVISVEAIPEPVTFSLFAVAMAGLTLCTRRRR